MTLPWVLCGVLFTAVLFLFTKICVIKKSVTEIRTELTDWLKTDTNTLISISSNDRSVRLLAAEINRQLRLLRSQRRQYLNGSRELRDAVTNISHDLRTPLTAICGYLDLLENEDKSETVAQYLNIIRNRTEMLAQLTEELFNYSIIMSSADEITTEPVAIGSVLEESIAAFYTSLTERGIVPVVRIPEQKIMKNADRSALARVFSNLLNNAIKYSDGDLDIELRETGEIIFTNTASGLDKVQTEKLFDRFYTVEAARKSTGLGLAIAKTLIEQMDGEISAQYSGGKLSISIALPD